MHLVYNPSCRFHVVRRSQLVSSERVEVASCMYPLKWYPRGSIVAQHFRLSLDLALLIASIEFNAILSF